MNFFGGLGNLGGARRQSSQREAQYADMLEALPGYYYERSDLEKGNKILLPSSVLNQIGHMKLPYPMIFQIENTANRKITYVGVLEFNAPDGQVILPFWLYQMLDLYDRQIINVTLINALSQIKGKFLKFQPHQTELMKQNYNAILEYVLRHFPVLHQGDTIPIDFNSKTYFIDILELQPPNKFNAVCVIDTDLNFDFVQPLDYVDLKQDLKLQKKSSKVIMNEESKNDPLLQQLQGKAFRWDGKQVDYQKLADDINKKQNEEKLRMENWDPRKHRLQHGIRVQDNADNHFDTLSKGFKLGQSK